MVNILSETERVQLAGRIAMAEAAAGVEIRLVIARRSADYASVLLALLLMALIVGSLAGTWLAWWPALDIMLGEAAAFSIAALAWCLKPVRRILIPSSMKHAAVSAAAHAAYGDFRRQLPSDHPAILFYCSVAERRAEYVYDRTIGVVIPETTWTETLKPFAAHMQGKSLDKALLHIVESIEANLKPYFPRKDVVPFAGTADDLVER